MRWAGMLGPALLALAASPAFAGPAEDRAALQSLRADDARLQAIGWNLATGNASFCDARPAIGLLVQDMANFSDPAGVRAAAGIAGDVAAQAVVPGSPAALAGIEAGDEIVSIDGRAMADLPPVKPGDWRRLYGLFDAVDAALDRGGSVQIGWRDAEGMHEASIAGVPACRTRFELLDGSANAVAEGKRVVIGRKFAGFGYPDDLFAAAVAHEVAHNLLAHRAWLNSTGRTRANIRTTEDEADRLTPWLLANAGYDPKSAVRLFERWGPKNGGGLFRSRNHAGWHERAIAIAAEIGRMTPLRDAGGRANWREHFVRTTR